MDPSIKLLNNEYNPKLYAKSKFNPPLAPYPVENEIYRFRDMIKELHTLLPIKPSYNIDKSQRSILSSFHNNTKIITLIADKGLGLTTFDRDEYIESILSQNLFNTHNYIISPPLKHMHKLQKPLLKCTRLWKNMLMTFLQTSILFSYESLTKILESHNFMVPQSFSKKK